MSKNKLQMNLLPVLLLVGLIIGAGYLLLKGEFKLPNLGNKDPEVRRLNGFPTVIYTKEEMDKKRVVIKSEAELQEFLRSVDRTGILQPSEPIDFSKEILVGAATKTLTQSGSELKIRKIYKDEENKKLLVNLKQTILDESCEEVENESNVAVDLVAIDSTDWTIDFDVVKEVRSCTSEEENSADQPIESSSSEN